MIRGYFQCKNHYVICKFVKKRGGQMCVHTSSEQSKLYVFFNLSTRLIIIICIFETIVTIITVCMYYYCQPNPRRSMKKSKNNIAGSQGRGAQGKTLQLETTRHDEIYQPQFLSPSLKSCSSTIVYYSSDSNNARDSARSFLIWYYLWRQQTNILPIDDDTHS